MKLSIGHYITIAMVSFMSFILYLVFTASTTKVDLTSEDYYQQEIEFESMIKAKQNGLALEDEIKLIKDGDFLQIHFLNKMDFQKIKGEFHFYKPNNNGADKRISFSDGKPLYVIKIADFEKGNYLLKISWKDDLKSYFIEKTIYIN